MSFNRFLKGEFNRAARENKKTDPIQKQWNEVQKTFDFMNETKKQMEKEGKW